MSNKMDWDCSQLPLRAVRRLDAMRGDKQKCSVAIKVGGGTIDAHREILIGASEYFEEKLLGDVEVFGETELINIDYESAKMCIDSIYGREIFVSQENYPNLIHVAKLMKLEEICRSIEEDIFNNLTALNVLKWKQTADLYECAFLSQKCVEFAEQNLALIPTVAPEFLDIDVSFLSKLLRSENTADVSEEDKLDIILKWASHDLDRKHDVERIIDMIDLSQISVVRLRSLLLEEPIINESSKLMRKLSLSATDPCRSARQKYHQKIITLEKDRMMMRLFHPRQRKVTESDLEKPNIKCPFSVASLGNYIYVIGEDKSVQRIKYDEEPYKWVATPKLLDEHGNWPPVTVLSNHIFVVGGSGGFSTERCEKFCPKENEWVRISNAPYACDGAAVVGFEGNLYSFGGRVHNAVTKHATKFTIDQSQWTNLEDMLEERELPSAAKFKDGIVVAGGYYKTDDIRGRENRQSVEYYKPKTNQWTKFPIMNVARSNFKLHYVNSSLFAVGGLNSTISMSKIEQYVGDDNEWKLVSFPVRMNIEICDSILIDSEVADESSRHNHQSQYV